MTQKTTIKSQWSTIPTGLAILLFIVIFLTTTVVLIFGYPKPVVRLTAVNEEPIMTPERLNELKEGKGASSVSEITTSEMDISDWLTYRDEEYGFDLKYPKDWTVKKTTDYVGSTEFVIIGGPEYGVLTEDPKAIIYFPNSINTAINSIGSQFTNRTVTQEETTVNGLNALLVTVTTSDLLGWKTTSVFIVGERSIYEIRGDIEDDVLQVLLHTFNFGTLKGVIENASLYNNNLEFGSLFGSPRE